MIHFSHYVGTKIREQKWQWIGWRENVQETPLIISLIDSNYIDSKNHLVGGLEHVLFLHTLGIIFPTDEVIFFRGVAIPATSKNHGFPVSIHWKWPVCWFPSEVSSDIPRDLLQLLGPDAALLPMLKPQWLLGTVALRGYEIWQFSEEMTDMTVLSFFFKQL